MQQGSNSFKSKDMDNKNGSNAVLMTYRSQRQDDAFNTPKSVQDKIHLSNGINSGSPAPLHKRRSPFRATKMWNQLVQAFKDGIELKKKRWKMRVYHNCFSGTEATNVIHTHLKANVSATTTRTQAIQLLQKFLHCHIIEDVCRKNSRMFHDDNHLYRIIKENDESSSYKRKGSPKTLVPSQKSLSKILGANSGNKQAGTVVKNKNSMLSSADKNSPRLSIIAESDCIGVKGQSSMTPLAAGLSNVNIFGSSLRERISSTSMSECKSSDASVELQGTKSKDSLQNPVVLQTQATKCHPSPLSYINNCYDSPYSPFSPDFYLARSSSLRVGRSRFFSDTFKTVQKDIVIDEKTEKTSNSPGPKKCENNEKNAILLRKSKLLRPRLRSRTVSLCSPPKKLKTDQDTKLSSKQVTPFQREIKTAGIDNFASDYIQKQPPRNSVHPPNTPGSEDLEYIWKTAALSSLKMLLEIDSLDNLLNFALINGLDIRSNFGMVKDDAMQEVPGWLVSAMKCLISWPPGSKDEEQCDLPNYEGFEHDIFLAIKDYYEKALEEPLLTYHFFKILQMTADLIPLEKQKCIKVLQLCCLMIPTWNRKQLQVLLRFMAKVSKNDDLRLSDDVPNEEVTIHNFQPMIINSKYPTVSDDLTGIRLVLFLVENHEEVFQPPSGLQAQIDYQLAMTLGNQEFPTLPEVSEHELPLPTFKRWSGPTTYCKQVTMDEYEREGVQETRAAISNLLQSIIADDVMTDKERKKKLKLFKKAYPEIYAAKFPGDNISTCSSTNQRAIRIKNVVRPFFFRHASTSY